MFVLRYRKKSKISGRNCVEMSPSTKTRHQARWVDLFDLEAIFIRLLVVGQHRQLQLTTTFQYELCAVPPSLIDEYCCLRKRNQSVLCNRIGVVQVDPSTSDVVIVDMQHMLYHIIWPHGGDAPMLFENTKQRLSSYHGYPPGTTNSSLPSRDAILKNKHNKLELSRIIILHP